MVQKAMDGTEYGDEEPQDVKDIKPSPVQPNELDKAYREFEEGNFLGDVLIKAVHVKDFKSFRDISIHDFGNDDWRAFKFMVKLYKQYKHFFELFKFIKPEGKQNDRNNKDSLCQ